LEATASGCDKWNRIAHAAGYPADVELLKVQQMQISSALKLAIFCFFFFTYCTSSRFSRMGKTRRLCTRIT
jgi:hypothetical protein